MTAALAMNASPGRFWATRVGFGLALGTAMGALEFAYYYPLLPSIGLGSVLSSLLVWSGEALMFVIVVSACEYRTGGRDLTRVELAIAIVCGVIAAVLTWHSLTQFVLRGFLGMRVFRDYLGTPVEWLGGVFYHAWLLLFFGTLASVAYASQRRSSRMLAALRAAQIAQAEVQQRLADAKLASLRARVDPEFVVETLTRLERLYETDADAAERLLDELIAFLRAAVSDVRQASARPAAVQAAIVS